MPKKRNSRSSRREISVERAIAHSRRLSLNRRVVIIEQITNVVSNKAAVPSNSSRRVVIVEPTGSTSSNKIVETRNSVCIAEPEAEFVLELEGNEFDFAQNPSDD